MAAWQVCASCGAIVADVDVHIAWHTRLVSLDPDVPSAPVLDLPETDPTTTPTSTTSTTN